MDLVDGTPHCGGAATSSSSRGGSWWVATETGRRLELQSARGRQQGECGADPILCGARNFERWNNQKSDETPSQRSTRTARTHQSPGRSSSSGWPCTECGFGGATQVPDEAGMCTFVSRLSCYLVDHAGHQAMASRFQRTTAHIRVGGRCPGGEHVLGREQFDSSLGTEARHKGASQAMLCHCLD